MPKIKPSPISAASETVMRNVRAIGAINGCGSNAEIANRIGMPKSTFSAKRKHPRGFTLEELIIISETFGCSLAWLVTEHSKELEKEA